MADQVEGLLSGYLRKSRAELARPFLKGTILDFGCGVGYLAGFVPNSKYIGVDRDRESLHVAKKNYPQHVFIEQLPPSGSYDTIIALAVIEHLPDPKALLSVLSALLAEGGKIIITTPHPVSDNVHWFGAKLGIFSRAAHEEHEHLFDKKSFNLILPASGLEILEYRRFLFGMNQLFVIGKNV
ncbi:MAG: methyltransferase type 11 [Parcubacteria group bacterium]|nr:MAG: methyltransferase type 11 [Parcubacteria group bacterium]